jgi:integral membrane protein
VKSNPLLICYRVLAYATGCMLLLLCGFMVAKYGFETARNATLYVAMVHGWLYAVYLLVVFMLGMQLKWPMGKLFLVLLAGTVPFASFVAERRVLRDLGQPAKAVGEPVRA